MKRRRNGVVRETERILGKFVVLPPRNHPKYMSRYKGMERYIAKQIEECGSRIVGIKESEFWLKKNGYLGIIAILIADLVWLTDSLMNL